VLIHRAIDSYESIAGGFPKSKYAAEAYFRLGDIYQTSLDSLDLARENFDLVPRQYANSPFAKDAVVRSINIAKFQRLQASLAAGESQDEALVQFELAEAELFQFKNTEKALAGYMGILNDHGDSEVAPKAAYAIAYIYEKVLNDETNAQRAYLRLLREYPSSQQAGFARAYLGITPEILEETRVDSSGDR
jgi:TolA-binding protein